MQMIEIDDDDYEVKVDRILISRNPVCKLPDMANQKVEGAHRGEVEYMGRSSIGKALKPKRKGDLREASEK